MKMKPCPLCGELPNIVENKINLSAILYGVYCSGEHHQVSVGYFDSEEEAIEVWNDRKFND